MLANYLPKVSFIRNCFARLYKRQEFIQDRTGAQTIEILNASFIADEPSIFGEINHDWNSRELEWYLSQSCKVKDIPPPVPKIWEQIADKHGFINSNYGWCIFSHQNGHQYDNALKALQDNSYTRQAIMIYNRPSMHTDSTYNGRQDFMCCQNSQHFIRDNTLTSHFNFRSSDAVFGYKGDVFWANYVHDKLYADLAPGYLGLQKGPIIWNAGSLHVYSRHFKLVEKYIQENNFND